MRILLLADVHIGSIKDTEYVYRVMTDIFDKELIFNKCDMVIFLGDYFHKLLKANEDQVSLAINIMSHLVRLCRKTKTKIRLIYGTESHEVSQYRLHSYHLASQSIDIKVIETVTEETIGDKHILYVPEEYLESKEKYYNSTIYGDKKYDYVFGHGVIVEGFPSNALLGGNNIGNEKKVPRFKVGELSRIGKLNVWGHYHCHTDMDHGCYYLGSLFRDSFGEEGPKGYGIIEDDKFTFIENTKAHIYRSYTYPEDSEIYSSVDKIADEIQRIRTENENIFVGNNEGKIRMIFQLPSSIDSSFKEQLQSLLFNEKGIASLMKEVAVNHDEIVATIEAEYDFILDPSLPLPDKIHRYIGKTYPEAELSLEEIKKFIEEDLQI